LVYHIVGRALNVTPTSMTSYRRRCCVWCGAAEAAGPVRIPVLAGAITIRQVRDREQARAADRGRRAHLEDAEAITDPALDFAG